MVDDAVDDDVFSYFLFKSCEFCVFSFCSMSRDLCVFLLVAAEAAAKLSLKLAEFFFLQLGYHPLVGVEVEKVKMPTFLGGIW